MGEPIRLLRVSATGTVSAECGGKHRASISSYDDLAGFLPRHAGEIVDGAPVVDFRSIPDFGWYRVWRLPMVDVDATVDEGCGSFDYVTLSTYVVLLEALGATVGRWDAASSCVVWPTVAPAPVQGVML